MTKSQFKNLTLLILMVAAAAAASVMRPTEILAKARSKVDLQVIIPKAFGDWRQLDQSNGQVVNPQQTALLASLYSQTLSRSYVNPQGEVIMLSIAYGENQGDGLALHYPDVCYPAQGFAVKSTERVTLATPVGTIPASRLNTELGRRKEPLTYWSTIGNKAVQGGTQRKLEQLRYGFHGQVPDGLIFRVSNINADAPRSYELQDQFIGQLLAAVPPPQRQFLSGISAN